MSGGGASAERTLERACSAFALRYGRLPTVGAVAPGRVNLIGEHTDYNGGFVLPIAIDRVCAAVGAPSADPGVSRVYAADLEAAAELDFRAPIVVGGPGPSAVERGSPLSYVAGVAAQFQRLVAAAGGRLQNLDVAIASEVPIGSGLSSSAAIEVSMATLLEQASGLRLGQREKALLCQRAEHEYAGVPCGIMDQFVSVMGRQGHALLIDCRAQEARVVRIPDAVSIVVINSNVRHSLTGGEYASRRAACAAAASKLGVPELRDADSVMLNAAGGELTAEEGRRARHVVGENARTLEAAAALDRRDLVRAGTLMYESHRSLQEDFEVSCPELDTLVEIAAGVPGVYGARMTGAGFGGCVVAMVEPGAVGALEASVTAGYPRRHGRRATVFQTLAGDGARFRTPDHRGLGGTRRSS